MEMLGVIYLGDIVGRSGRQAVAQQLPAIRQKYQPDLVIANAENAANGSGLTPELFRKLQAAGIDAMTLGDHVYKKQQIAHVLETEACIVRPANLPSAAKGKRWMTLPTPKGNVHVLLVLGRIFMNMPAADPFVTAQEIIAQLPEKNPMVILEAHCEATSEKQALGWHFNNRVAAVIGSHTHVATADARILPSHAGHAAARRPTGSVTGTAYITDMGMCGPHESVLGRAIEPVLKHMTTAMPAPFDVAEGDPRVNGVYLKIDPATGLTAHIERVEFAADPAKPPFTAV